MLVSKKEVMKEIFNYFKQNDKLILLVNDMGFAVLDDYCNSFPKRTINVGIAEQSTIGIAAGMAKTGLIPLVYSQIPFLVMRSYEQIRYDINEHNLNIKLIGIGANNYFKSLGRSHCIDNDDIYMMKIFKNFLILSPTKQTLKNDIKKMFEYNGPVYLRSL